MVFEECKEIFSTHFPFWEHLSEEEQKTLCLNTLNSSFKKGEHIHSGDTDCNGVMTLKSGHLRVFLLSDEGREITLYRMYPGDMCTLSAACVLNNIEFDVFIDAEEDSELLIINSKYFDTLLNENIYVENFTYKLLTKRFSDVMWSMQQILFTSFDKRLARFLIDESENVNNDKIKITHEQIAKYMGSAREVVSRMLKYFENEGFVKLYRGGIQILDKQALEDLSI
ncbi:MAG: Crp/Fnr family transcriptional regulator [Acutalibacteraceae bacterium]|jgi:CRP/FNR family transcriptional regulator|nr:Crp/Fnr family transcriptional regulator [Clostridiales bacterium]